MEPTSGKFPPSSPGQLGYPELTPAQLADPMTPVTVNGLTMDLWQVGHIYGVQHELPVDHGKGKETAAAEDPGEGPQGNTAQSSNQGAADQSSSRIGRGQQLSHTSSGTSGSFYARSARHEGIVGYPTGGGPTPVPRTRSASRERPEPPTPAPRPKYSLFPRIDPPRTPQTPTPTTPHPHPHPLTTTNTTRAPEMAQPTGPSKPGQGQQGQPELKSVWERSPSPPDWKKTMKGAVTKGLRQVSSSLNLRSKKSKAGLKESPQNQGEDGGQGKSATPGQEHVPPMPPMPWNTNPVPGHQPTTPGPTRPAASRGPESGTSGPTPGSQFAPPGPTAARPHNLRPPPEGRYRSLHSGRAGPSAANLQPFAPEQDDDPTSAPPPIPPRSARRPPPPEAAQGMSQNQMTTQNRPAQSPAPTIDAPVWPRAPVSGSGPTATTTLSPFSAPRYPPPPPPPPHSPPREEQQRGRSRSITNLFRKARESDDKTSKGSK